MSRRTHANAATAAFLAVALLAPASVHSQQAPPDPLEASKVRAAAEGNEVGAAYLLIAGSPMVKVMPDGAAFGGSAGAPVEIHVARGEVEAGQVVIAPLDRALTDVTYRITDLVGPTGARLPPDRVELAVVGYVRTDPAVELYYEVERRGWFPDPILPFVDRFDVPRDRVQSLWLSVRPPAGQPAGVYEGRVEVSPGNAEPRSIAVRVRVYDFDVPRERSLPVTVATFEEHLAAIHGDAWGDDLRRRYADFLLDHRLNYDNPYRDHGPPPSPDEVARLLAGGQDAWALRFIRQPGQGFSDVGPDSALYEEYLDRAVAESRATLSALREAGAAHLAYVYLYDEVRENHWPMLRKVAERLRDELPGVPVMTSAFDPEFGHGSRLDEVVDVWVAIIAHFRTDESRAKVERARSKGARVIWYTTIWPPRPYPNLFLEYDGIEPRLLMGAMTQKFRPDGFGYWASSAWFGTDGQRPLTSGPYTDWNPLVFGNGNAEGSLIYAGEDGPITSIRFENFRDGIEDYEYYRLLESAIRRAEDRGEAGPELNEARSLLEVPEELVRGLTEFSRDPGILMAHRIRIAEAIERLTRR